MVVFHCLKRLFMTKTGGEITGLRRVKRNTGEVGAGEGVIQFRIVGPCNWHVGSN